MVNLFCGLDLYFYFFFHVKSTCISYTLYNKNSKMLCDRIPIWRLHLGLFKRSSEDHSYTVSKVVIYERDKGCGKWKKIKSDLQSMALNSLHDMFYSNTSVDLSNTQSATIKPWIYHPYLQFSGKLSPLIFFCYTYHQNLISKNLYELTTHVNSPIYCAAGHFWVPK